MSTWIWQDHPALLRVAVVVISILFLLLSFGQLNNWYEHPGSWLEPSLAVLFAVSSYGLLHMKPWARWVAVVILWFLVVTLIVGIFNPFMASDWMGAGIQPPSVATLLVYIVPAEIIIIWTLHILGKYKQRFE